MRLTRRSSQASRRDLARTYRWATAWLVAGGVLAILLLANSIRDYRFVSRLLAVQQVRQGLSQYVVALEQKIRRSSAPGPSAAELVADAMERAHDKPLWIEIRRPDGDVLARGGSAATRLFSSEEESAHFRSREALFRIVPASVGDAVVEVFPVYAPGLAVLSQSTASGSDPSSSTPPSSGRSANLVINCSGALALLATVMAGSASAPTGAPAAGAATGARSPGADRAAPVSNGGLRVRPLATVYRPAEQVSGDFYDVFRVGDGRTAIILGDVSGKGVPAALVMGVIHGAVRSSAWSESTGAHERESEKLNLLLCENASGSRFTSMFWCHYEPRTRLLCYINAGHCPPLLVGDRSHGPQIASLDAGGPVLGILPAARYEQARCEVHPGDVLVLYSDGLIEATNPAGEEYGESRLRELLAAVGAGSPDAIRDAILTSASAFLGAATPRDDVTLAVAKFT